MSTTSSHAAPPERSRTIVGLIVLGVLVVVIAATAWVGIRGLQAKDALQAAVLTAGLPVAAMITGGSWLLYLGLWGVLGIGTSMISTPSSRLLRRVSTDGTRSYLFTAQFSLSHACFMLTYPVAGWLGAAVGQPTAALVLGGLALAGTVAALVVWPAPSPRAAKPSRAASV